MVIRYAVAPAPESNNTEEGSYIMYVRAKVSDEAFLIDYMPDAAQLELLKAGASTRRTSARKEYGGHG